MTSQVEIREVLKALNPSVAHRAAQTPDIRDIYAPPSHADALDPERSLVVGSRGVGKSFWASVLNDEGTRSAAAAAYPKLNLDHFDVYLGFHEGAGGLSSVAPAASVLRRALEISDDPVWIWRSVVLQALLPDAGPTRLTERIRWLQNDPEVYQELLNRSEVALNKRKRRALIVFDALDVMATDWGIIRELTIGLARLALEMISTSTIRVKMFMRRDQFNDMRRKTFADFSKLRTAAVELDWSYRDLYGALFSRLWRDERSTAAIRQLAAGIGLSPTSSSLPRALRDEETAQEQLFSAIAGEFMGVNAKRGRTYLWLPRHLADGHGETSLRSFLIALKEAAENTSDRSVIAVDRNSINQGVLKASETRREEIKEDHPWVEDAIPPLEGLIVPCEDIDLIQRWIDNDTLKKIRRRHDPERPSAPVQLASLPTNEDELSAETVLLQALAELGVIERRSENRVNVPDIYRVTAKIKRKGGLAPRKRV